MSGWDVDEGSVALGLVIGLLRIQISKGLITTDDAKALLKLALPEQAGVNTAKVRAKIAAVMPELFGGD